MVQRFAYISVPSEASVVVLKWNSRRCALPVGGTAPKDADPRADERKPTTSASFSVRLIQGIP